MAGCREELRCQNFGFCLRPGESIGLSVLGMENQSYFVLWRCASFTYLTAVLLWDFTNHAQIDRAEFYFITLTHWTLLFEVVYFSLASIVSYRRLQENYTDDYLIANGGGKQSVSDRLAVTTWVFQEFVYTGSFAVCVIYWLLVYDGDLDAFKVHVHGGNAICSFLDCFLNASPVRILHAWAPMMYCATFVVWSGIHFGANIGDNQGNAYIYPFLDWDKPLQTFTYVLVIGLVVLPSMHVVMYGVNRLGGWVFGGRLREEEQPIDVGRLSAGTLSENRINGSVI